MASIVGIIKRDTGSLDYIGHVKKKNLPRGSV